MPLPTCNSTCDADLPAVDFSECNPVIAYSEIRRIFIAKKTATPFNNWKLKAEWETRLSQSSVVGDDYIRTLTVIADKPAAAGIVKEISNQRRIVVGKDHTVNFTIDDVSDANYEFMLAMECGGEYLVWYETNGGYMYGGNGGIKTRLQLDDVLNRGGDEIETFAGVLSWRDKFSPERTKSPIFDGENITPPTSYDTVQTFSDAATKTTAGVTTTLSAVDPDAKYEFNAIASPVGTPNSMSIKVASAEQATVDFPSDYLGTPFRYTDVGGTAHVGVFTNGDVNF